MESVALLALPPSGTRLHQLDRNDAQLVIRVCRIWSWFCESWRLNRRQLPDFVGDGDARGRAPAAALRRVSGVLELRSVVRGPPSVQQLQQARTAASVRTDALIVSKQERARRSRRGTAEPRTQAHFISGSIECLTSSPPSSSPLFCPRPAARGAFIMTAIRCAAALLVLAHGDQHACRAFEVRFSQVFGQRRNIRRDRRISAPRPAAGGRGRPKRYNIH